VSNSEFNVSEMTYRNSLRFGRNVIFESALSLRVMIEKSKVDLQTGFEIDLRM
jgi:hypothetical protein